MGVHIIYLIGFRRRFIVMAEWAWLHLRNERGARLITGDVESLLKRGRQKPRACVWSDAFTARNERKFGSVARRSMDVQFVNAKKRKRLWLR
jgi:hypothetical protein